MKRAPVALELFCGCGGLSTGFLDAGIRVAAGFDIDARSIEAYNYNHIHRGSRGAVIDLASATGEQLLKVAGLKRVDLLLGGPPCQPFSVVGKRLGSEDDRAGLIFDFLRLAGELQPQAIFFENVPNLISIHEGRLFAKLTRGLRRLGYTVRAEVVAAADYGVPQYRRRLLLMAAKDVTEVTLPEATHGAADLLNRRKSPYATVRDAIDDLPMAADFGVCGVHNHEPTEHSLDMLDRLSRLKPGERERSSFHDRLHPDRPSYTLRAGTGNFSPLRPIHYQYDRVITVRESARIQTFSDEFIWPDWIPRLQQYRQVGNAVPPRLASVMARALATQLGWSLQPRALKGRVHSRPNAITLSDEERRKRRLSRIRGASLGGGAGRSKKRA